MSRPSGSLIAFFRRAFTWRRRRAENQRRERREALMELYRREGFIE